MIRRRFYSSYKSPVDNGVYAVKQDGRLIPLSKADYQCISVAIVHDDHKIMIEKNEDSNQSYKDASAGYNRSYLFYWGGYGRERAGLHPPGPPPSSHRLPLFLASFWFYPQIFISLGQKYNHV